MHLGQCSGTSAEYGDSARSRDVKFRAVRTWIAGVVDQSGLDNLCSSAGKISPAQARQFGSFGCANGGFCVELGSFLHCRSVPCSTTASDNRGNSWGEARGWCRQPRFLSGNFRGSPGDHRVKRANASSQHPPVKSHRSTVLTPGPGPTQFYWTFYAFLLDLRSIPGAFSFPPFKLLLLQS